MRPVLSVWVPGRPKTKGSLSVVNGRRGVLRENVAGSSEWRALMRGAVEAAMVRVRPALLQAPLAGPVFVLATFFLPVAEIVERAAKGGYRRSGDLDKLSRNLLDALQDARVYEDDVQVTRLWVDKVAAGTGPAAPTGVQIEVGVP